MDLQAFILSMICAGARETLSKAGKNARMGVLGAGFDVAIAGEAMLSLKDYR